MVSYTMFNLRAKVSQRLSLSVYIVSPGDPIFRVSPRNCVANFFRLNTKNSHLSKMVGRSRSTRLLTVWVHRSTWGSRGPRRMSKHISCCTRSGWSPTRSPCCRTHSSGEACCLITGNKWILTGPWSRGAWGGKRVLKYRS